MVTITILYDNEIYQEGLKADWGFSCLIEKEGSPTILFDTGANGRILFFNMRKLRIDSLMISEVFISHNHWDHTGGLPDFLRAANKKIKVYIPSSMGKSENGEEIVPIKEPMQLHQNFFSTGELKGVEQSLVIKEWEKLVVIAGCSHSGVGNILKAASQFGKVKTLIGGLHGFSEFDLIKDLDLVCPTHCTQFKSKIKNLYPEKYIYGGAGKIILNYKDYHEDRKLESTK